MKYQKFNVKKTLFILILYILYFILNTNIVNAQTVSLSISPPLIETIIKPGKSIMIAYRIENSGDPAILTAKVLPFEPKDNLGNIYIKKEFSGPVRFSLDNADLQLDQAFFVKTRESQQLLLRIRIPDGTPNGDYYYSLLVESQPPSTSDAAGSARVKATIGSNILITVTDSGVVDIKGKVTLFDVLSRFSLNLLGKKINFFDSNDQIPVVLILENDGKNLIKPSGEIVLRGNFGEKATYDILPQNILSQSQRIIAATPSAQIDCENGRQKSCLYPTSLIIPGFFLGYYKLNTTISLGENAPNIFGSTSFLALPFKLLIGILVTVLIGFLVIKKIKKTE